MHDEVASPDARFRLDGRVAIVTGASSGLGAQFAAALHRAGATVVLAARRVDRLEDLADRLGAERAVPVPCDVTVDRDRVALVERATAIAGRLDVLVNNAGSGPELLPAEEEPIDRLREVLEVNVTSLFRLAQLAAGPMLSQEAGSIINVASVMGLVGSAPLRQASYCASKGAVVNLTRELACQWARRGIRVNALAPGWFPSEMTAELFADEGSRRYLERGVPMGRLGRDGELDGALLFLATSASSYCTGHVLTVDGGWTAR